MSEPCKLLEYPPTGEMNHSIGLCYCHMCTCGEHKCPCDQIKPKNYFQSALASTYKKDFTKKPFIPSELIIRDNALNPGCNKMDLKTISKQDYVKHKIEKTKSAKYLRESTSRVLKFAGVTNYQSEFPNWGHYQFINIGGINRQAGKNNVKLSPVTTYKQNYCKEYTIRRTQSQKKTQKSNPLTSCADFFAQTTNKEYFGSFKNTNFPKRVKNKDHGIFLLESSKGAYDTMYKTEYNKKESPLIFLRKKDVEKQLG